MKTEIEKGTETPLDRVVFLHPFTSNRKKDETKTTEDAPKRSPCEGGNRWEKKRG